MDIPMPECNGFQAALALRRDARSCGIATINCTALDEMKARKRLTDHVFDGCF
jgi:CheY-like chemotaxis protein